MSVPNHHFSYYPQSRAYDHHHGENIEGVVQIIDEATPFANFIRQHLMNPYKLSSLLKHSKFDKKIIVHHVIPKKRTKSRKAYKKTYKKKATTYYDEKPSKFDDFKKEMYANDPYDSFYYDPSKEKKSTPFNEETKLPSPEEYNAAILEAFSPAWAESIRYPSIMAFNESPSLNRSNQADIVSLYSSSSENKYVDNLMPENSFKWFFSSNHLHPKLMLPTVSPTASPPSLFYHSVDDYSNPIYQQMPILTKDTRQNEATPIGLNVHNATNVLYVVKIEPKVIHQSDGMSNHRQSNKHNASLTSRQAKIFRANNIRTTIKAKHNNVNYKQQPSNNNQKISTSKFMPINTKTINTTSIGDTITSYSKQQSKHRKTTSRTTNAAAQGSTFVPVHSNRYVPKENIEDNNNMWTSSEMIITNDQHDLEAIPSIVEYTKTLPLLSRKRNLMNNIHHKRPSSLITTTTSTKTSPNIIIQNNQSFIGLDENVKLIQVGAKINVKDKKSHEKKYFDFEQESANIPKGIKDGNIEIQNKNDNDQVQATSTTSSNSVTSTISNRFFTKKGIVIDDSVGFALDPMFAASIPERKSKIFHKNFSKSQTKAPTSTPEVQFEKFRTTKNNLKSSNNSQHVFKTTASSRPRSAIITDTTDINPITQILTTTTNKPKRGIYKFDLNMSNQNQLLKNKEKYNKRRNSATYQATTTTLAPEHIESEFPKVETTTTSTRSESIKLSQVYNFMSERINNKRLDTIEQKKENKNYKIVNKIEAGNFKNISSTTTIDDNNLKNQYYLIDQPKKHSKERNYVSEIKHRNSSSSSPITATVHKISEVNTGEQFNNVEDNYMNSESQYEYMNDKRGIKKLKQSRIQFCKQKGEGFYADTLDDCKVSE